MVQFRFVVFLVFLGLAGVADAQPIDSTGALADSAMADSTVADSAAEVEYVLEPIVVTATRIPRPAWDVAGDVTVIDARRIELSSPQDLGDALRLAPGVGLGRYGSPGQNISLGLRGSTAAQVLIMVDGRPVNDPQLGGLDLNVIPLDNIERVELVRGGASALYGANAVGGVINVITRPFDYEKPYSNIVIERGDYGHKRTGVQFGRNLGSTTTFFLTGEFIRSGGDRANSDYKGDKINGILNIALERGCDVSVAFGKYRGRLGVPGSDAYPSPRARQGDDRWDLALTVRGKDESGFNTEALLYYADARQSYRDPDPVWGSSSTHEHFTYGGRLQQSVPLFARHLILWGGEAKIQKFESSDIGSPTTGQGAIFGQDEIWLTDKTRLHLMGRLDHHSSYGTQVSPGLILCRKLGDRTLLFSSVNRSFRAPTANELYWYNPDPYWPSYGNRDLRPERGISLDLGLRAEMERRATVSTTIFHRRMTDLVEWETDPLTWETRAVNKKRAWFTGLDSQVDCGLNDWLTMGLSVSLLRSEDRDAGRSFPYRPWLKLGGSLQYADDFLDDEIGVKIRLEGEHLGERFVGYDESEKLSALTLIKATIALRFLDLQASVVGENLFNRSYMLRKGYPMPGRVYRWGLTWRFWD